MESNQIKECFQNKSNSSTSQIFTRILPLLLMTLFLLQCENQVEGEGFYAYLENLPETGISDSILLNQENSELYKPHSLAVDDSGQAIIIDGTAWSLHLINGSGEVQSSAGGLGSGPGEFRIINGLEIGMGNSVDVLDNRQNRLTNFDFSGGCFELVGTMSLPDYST